MYDTNIFMVRHEMPVLFCRGLGDLAGQVQLYVQVRPLPKVHQSTRLVHEGAHVLVYGADNVEDRASALCVFHV